MTSSIDKKLDVDGAIDIPIKLDEVQTTQFLFYLANKIPLTATELAADCISDADGVKSQVQTRFANELNIGMADTITLSGTARKAVISGGRPYIESGQQSLHQGRTSEDEGELQAAADFYRQAVTLFQVVKTRFEAVDHESAELNDVIETSKQRHDEAAKEAAKDTVNYHTLLATQYESEGDECRDSDTSTAVSKYEDAKEELLTARASAEDYNESRLTSESSILSLDPIEDKIESISQKAKEIDVDKTVSLASEKKREEMLEILQDIHNRLDRAPKANELRENCKYSRQEFYNEFGSWDEALGAAGIDKEQAMLDDIQRVAEKLGYIPNTSDMSEYGAYTSYSKYFGSWSKALEKSGVAENFPEKSKVTREEKLEILQSLRDSLGRVPKTTELPDDCKYSPNDFYNEFGSWDEALEAAGMNKEQAMLNDIQRVAETIGYVPNTGDMSEYGNYSGYSNHFGSWSEALEKSGVAESFPEKLEGAREEKLEILQSLRDNLARVPTTTELPDECRFSPSDYYDEFGSWDEALEAAGIDKTQAILNEIEQVAEKLGRTPTTGDMSEYGAYPDSWYSSHFGSWSNALQTANIASIGESNPSSEAVDRSGKSDSPTTLSNEADTTKQNKKDSGEFSQTTNIEDTLDYIDGVGRTSLHAVNKAGYNTLGELCDAQPNEVSKYKGIGQSKAQKLIQFAIENVSGEQSRKKSSSNTRSQAHGGAGQSVDPESGTDHPDNTGSLPPEVEDGAVIDVRESISDNTRHTQQFVLKLTKIETSGGVVNDIVLSFVDRENNEIPMELWKTHELDIDWEQGSSYAISNVNGSAWEADPGEFEKRLNSTERTEVIELDYDLNPAEFGAAPVGTNRADAANDGVNTEPSTSSDVKADEPASTIDTNQSTNSESNDVFAESGFESAEVDAEAVSTESAESEDEDSSQESPTHSEPSGSASKDLTDDSEQTEDESEEDGILGDIVSDFDDID